MKMKRLISVLLAAVLCALALASCNGGGSGEGEQGGTKAPEAAKLEKLTKTSFEFDAPALPGTKSKELLGNPDRGFRLEVCLQAATGKNHSGDDAEDAIAAFDSEYNYYKDDKPVLAQTYVYLTEYCNTPTIPQEAIDNISKYFDHLHSKGIRMILRFAYQHESKDGPTAN